MNEKIILVDDDNHILTSVSVALRNEGWQVETYPDGEKGLIALQKNIPDLVILDIKMPRIDGMEMLKRLRISSNVPVIFLTSKDEEIDEALGLRMGADDYITKPFSQKLLIERIRAVFSLVKMPLRSRSVSSCICTFPDVRSRLLLLNCRVGPVPVVLKISPIVKLSCGTSVVLSRVNFATEPPALNSRVPSPACSSPPEIFIEFLKVSFPSPLNDIFF